MNRNLWIAISLALLLGQPLFAATKKEKEQELLAGQQMILDNLRREVEALKKIKAEKLDGIEALESKRWEERYRQNRLVQDHQEQVRGIEGRYSRSATDLSRLNDELVQLRSVTADMKDKAELAGKSVDDLAVQVQQAVDKAATELSADFPIELEQRNLNLSRARQALDAGSTQSGKAVDLLFETMASRYALTLDQEFTNRNSQIGMQAEVPVYRLKLGTIFLAEAARSGSAVQNLQRTGTLQGKVFEWRSDLSESFAKDLREGLMQVQQGNPQAWISIDVLQNKSAQSTTRKNQELTTKQKAKEFFRAGGPVMYPLALVAILALLLSLERWITFTRRGGISKKFLKALDGLVEQKKWQEAHALALAQKTSLGNALAAILGNVKNCSRSGAEKALRECLLREQPRLEQRMGLLGALGSSAPLLGLLGTVTGMISLFKVITEVGTNDAKVLAGGISEALITTETGLVIAIPVLLLHGWLTERLDIITSQLGIQSITLANRLWPEADEKAP
jgi:biopolymer transport protein ExbB